MYCVKASPETSNRGVHFISKEKMNSWVNGEREGSKSGVSADCVQHYSFVHQVFGQMDVVEKILKPCGLSASTGFSKRFAQGYFFNAPMEAQQMASSSKNFLIEMINWMGKNITEKGPDTPADAPNEEADHKHEKEEHEPEEKQEEEEEEEEPARHHLDAIAETMYRKVQQAVNDWTKANEHKMEERPGRISPFSFVVFVLYQKLSAR